MTNRAIQPGLMILAGAALVIVAVLLPALVLRPAGRVEPVKQTPAGPTRIVEKPAAQSSAPTPSITQAPAPPAPEESGDLSRAQRFRMVELETLKRLGIGGLSTALARSFVFPHMREDAIFGIDVSHHNEKNCRCEINWERVSGQKVAFVVAKASEGLWFRDPDFRAHWRELEKVTRIHRGAYHFMSADDDPEAQANYFLATVGPLQSADLPPVLDLEWDTFVRATRKWTKRDGDYWSQLNPDEILERVLTWLDIVEKRTGRIPIVYTSRAWWDGRIKDDKKLQRLKRYPIWLSAMEEKDLQLERPGAKGGWADKWDWKIWQFTNRGDLSKAGIPNPRSPGDERFDVNIFRGSLTQFQQAMGIVPPIVVAENKISEKINPGGSSPPDSAAAAPKEPPKETQSTGTPAPDGGVVAPKEAPTEAPKETQSAGTPVPDGGAAAPKEPPKETQTAGIPLPDGSVAAPKAPPKENQPAETPAPEGGVAAPKEPPKEAQSTGTPAPGGSVAAPKEPPKETQTAGVPGLEGGAAAPKEPPKETQSTGTPAPDGSVAAPKEAPKENQTAETPAPDSGVAVPNEPPKETQIAAVPVPDGGVVAPKETPKETQSTGTPAPDGSVAAPKEQPKETQSAGIPAPDGGAAAPKEPPKETQTAGLPAPDGSTAAAKEPPKENQAAGTPAADGNIAAPKEPPEESQTAGPPAPEGGAPPSQSPTKDAQAAETPAPDSNAAASGAGGTTVPPVEPERQVAAVSKPEIGTDKPGDSDSAKIPGAAGGGDATGKLPTATPSQKVLIEIVLANGRALRVDSNIDPDVLMRFVTLLERQ
jgi:lysozyme